MPLFINLTAFSVTNVASMNTKAATVITIVTIQAVYISTIELRNLAKKIMPIAYVLHYQRTA